MKNGLSKSGKKEFRLIAETMEEAGTCMLTTVDHNGGLSSRPMNALELDTEGSLWFIVLSDSHLLNEIRRIPVVNLTFTAANQKFISALAIGYEAFDKNKMHELWDPSMKKWFHEKIIVEDLTLLKLDLQEVEYWGASNSPLLKVIDFMSALTGDQHTQEVTYEKVDLRQ